MSDDLTPSQKAMRSAFLALLATDPDFLAETRDLFARIGRLTTRLNVEVARLDAHREDPS